MFDKSQLEFLLDLQQGVFVSVSQCVPIPLLDDAVMQSARFPRSHVTYEKSTLDFWGFSGGSVVNWFRGFEK